MSGEWLIGYDIASPRRLGRVHRRMVNWAMPVEYSIFLFVGTPRQLAKCLDDIAGLIDVREDDVRCYPLPQRGVQERLGRPTLPVGVQWTGLPGCTAG